MHPLPPALAEQVAASRRRDLLGVAETRRTASLGKRLAVGLGRPVLIFGRESWGERVSVRPRV